MTIEVYSASKLRDVLSTGSEPHLMTGEQYKESLRDGRKVIDSEGNEIEDVTTHPTTKRAIENIAGIYDMQFDPETRDIATYIDPEDGKRYSTNWLIPKKKEDLKLKREMLRRSTYHTLGVFGRPNDYGSMMAISVLSVIDKIEEESSEYAQNIREYTEFGKKHNIMGSDLIPDVQTYKGMPAKEKKGTLRVVEERPDGLVLNGAKPCGSVSIQAHFATISTVLSPTLEPEASIWCSVPINSPGVMLVLREPVTSSDSSFEDHPIDSFGEEFDCLMIFDNVFIPNNLIFSYKNKKLLGLYLETGGIPHWHILSRLMYRAEIFVGVAQTIADILGTDTIPGVRNSITEVMSYATSLKAHVLAGEEEAEIRNGLLIPSGEFITSGRLHSIVEYPKIMHILRDLSGQGLISRFTKEVFEHSEVGPILEEYLPGNGVTAREKNLFFNFLWDLACGSHSARVALFENLNSTNEPVIRAQLYGSVDRSKEVGFIREYLDLPEKDYS